MPLKSTSANTPGLKVDFVDFGVDADIAGTCLVRIDEIPSGDEFFIFIGDKTANDEGFNLGVRSTMRAYVWTRANGVNITLTGTDDVHEMELGKWHRFSWALHQTDAGEPIQTVWLDDKVLFESTITGYGSIKPQISGWDRFAILNRYDSSPNNYTDMLIQDVGVWVGADASKAATAARHAVLYNSGVHLRLTDSSYAEEVPFANWPLDLESGTPTVGDAGFEDQQGNYSFDSIQSGGGLSYVAKNMERVTRAPYFGFVQADHFQRLFQRGLRRRLLGVGDSHMNKDPADRFMEGMSKRWPFTDIISQTGGFRLSGDSRSGHTVVSILAGTVETEIRPGEVAIGEAVNVWGHGTEWNFVSTSTASLFAHRLTDFADGNYYHASPGGAPQWFNGKKYAGRPIVYYDGGGSGQFLEGFRTKCARGASTGSFTQVVLSGDGWQVLPLQIGSGSVATTDTGVDVSVTGDGSYDTNGKYVFCAGAQVVMLEEDNLTPQSGLAFDSFSPYGWDTIDHERESGGSRHYTNAHAVGYLNATRLHDDEHMILMFLLSHEIGTASVIKAQYQAVIDRWRTICADAGYYSPDIWCIGAWMVATENTDDMDEEAVMLAELQAENPDVSFIALSAYQQHKLHNGVFPSATDYLDGSDLHWDTLAGTEFWGDELYDCMVASLDATDNIPQRESKSSRSRGATGGLRRTHRAR